MNLVISHINHIYRLSKTLTLEFAKGDLLMAGERHNDAVWQEAVEDNAWGHLRAAPQLTA